MGLRNALLPNHQSSIINNQSKPPNIPSFHRSTTPSLPLPRGPAAIRNAVLVGERQNGPTRAAYDVRIARVHSSGPARHSFRWQLEVACHNSGNCDVLVELLPAQGISVDFHLNPCELLVGRRRQNTEPVGRKANNPPIVKLHVDRPPLGPSPQRGRLHGQPWLTGCGTHRMPFAKRRDARKPTAQCVVSPEAALRGCRPGEWSAPARTYTLRQESERVYAPAPFAHPSKSGI
jgi:hypothetical protein